MNLRTALDELVNNVQGLTSDEKGITFIHTNVVFIVNGGHIVRPWRVS